ncbi:hypothetical protein EDB83DRAFT_2362273 [Lactarius deliciosus]|nr:hypothetical protein EDB83DRAFT_2362273 [Lactarius deliciosus]
MPTSIENHGSTARDYCMLERNFLSHVKLALLLMLVSSSVLLQARLDSPTNPEEHGGSHKLSIPLATIEVISAFIVVGSGLWEYESGIRDMRVRRAFLLSTEPHFVIVAVIAAVVFITWIVFLVNEGGIGS